MKRILCAINDRKSEQYGPVMGFLNDADAIRSFTDAVNTPGSESMVYLHPDDFDLFRIGMYDTDDGVMVPEVHRRLITGTECKSVKGAPVLREVK